MKNILDKVSLFEKRISELSINRRKSRSEFKNSNQTRIKSRSRSRKRFNPNGKYCYFNFMFGPPVYSKAHQLDSKKLEIAKQEFKFMLDKDIIRPFKSPWACPLHLVNKKDRSVRACGDYRRLNAQIIPDRYPIPRIEDFQHILKGKRIFSRIDLFKAYFEIPIAEEDKEKTVIITPFGLFLFNVMSFGLRNAPATFQCFINEVLLGQEFFFYAGTTF
ncbi:hypothetical protein TNCV_3595281 [Trichonephila clavipes]|nr:hypothetical protein TNCV_3595281 [Trichonephila clavipes]